MASCNKYISLNHLVSSVLLLLMSMTYAKFLSKWIQGFLIINNTWFICIAMQVSPNLIWTFPLQTVHPHNACGWAAWVDPPSFCHPSLWCVCVFWVYDSSSSIAGFFYKDEDRNRRNSEEQHLSKFVVYWNLHFFTYFVDTYA